MKTRVDTRKKEEDPDKLFSNMLELYTMVPPSPQKLKKKRKSKNKKSEKTASGK